MSLADVVRIKNLEADFATLTRRLDALEKYVTELPEPDASYSTPVPEILRRGPGRPKKGS